MIINNNDNMNYIIRYYTASNTNYTNKYINNNDYKPMKLRSD